MLIILPLLLAAAAAAVLVRLRSRRAPARPALRTLWSAPHDHAPALLRAFLPLLRVLAGFMRHLPLPGVRARYARLIERAGLPYELTADEFLAIKVIVALAALAGALSVYYVLYRHGAVLAALVLLGIAYPDIRLSSAALRHQQACLRALPAYLDLLALSVEAGMGFDAAVLNLTQTLEAGPLTWRLLEYLRSVNIGKTRTEALRETARRLDLPDFTAFAGAVIQAAESGACLAPVLRATSAEMLERRFERAEKAAHELPVKMLLPLFVFVFPATFLMILVPLYFQFMASGAAEAFR